LPPFADKALLSAAGTNSFVSPYINYSINTDPMTHSFPSQPDITQTDEQVPVLIAGGGITGLTAALFLLQHGIRPMVVEQHGGTSIHPRARGFDMRTMELFRELGVDEAIREAGKALAPAWGMLSGATLTGALGERSPERKAPMSHPVQQPGMEAIAALSPVMGAKCTQDLAEPILLKAARKQGADVRFYTELVSFTQDEAGVTVQLKDRNDDMLSTVRCRYMIAADGAKSSIREALHASVSGRGALGHLLNIYFEADLTDLVKGREFSICRITQDGVEGLLTSINNSDRWVFHLHFDPLTTRPEQFSAVQLEKMLAGVIGIPHLYIRILSVLPWEPTVKVADKMQHGRIFLAGDAAHVMTPYGGKGAATGVQDVHNLAWKLAAVLQGMAPEALLETYHTERHPVGKCAAELSGCYADEKGLLDLKQFAFITREGLFDLEKMKYAIGFAGYTYKSAAIAATGHPLEGRLVPHIWLGNDEQRMSTLDLFKKNFVLLGEDCGWCAAAVEVNAANCMHIDSYCIGQDCELREAQPGQWREATGLDAGDALLVRPDGFICAVLKANAGDRKARLEEAIRWILQPESMTA
jgi:2-polyprenyl-6-methoxyphenol hydroxylase-like FAD-dependent oxidoreductase